MRKVLNAAKCSQMSNPKDGTGNGGDRCTEAVAAMIARTYNVPIPGLPANYTGEQAMYWFTQMLNKGSDVSALEDAAWISKWMGTHGGPAMSNIHGPRFQDIVNCIDRNHVAVAGFNNYAALRLTSGGNPYKWTDPSNIGHVILVVGYDTGTNSVIVHDPLRADPSGQPADYAWSSFSRAGFSDLSEIQGGTLNQSATLLQAMSSAGNLFAPDESVAQFFAALDAAEELRNPFSTQIQTILGVPTNATQWAQNTGTTLWADAGALLFRLLVVIVGFIMIIGVIRSWLPQHTTVSQRGAQAAQVASIAMLA